VYTPAEIANIREACRIGRLALDAVGMAIKVGVTTDELDAVCHAVHVANGVSGLLAPLNS
jgi:methionyl aminopeptidase